ncbi:hypothetical protein M0R45_000146 [Rubus argutus]|uniref:EF-hand domain-containing protein n=1 Tax=Rubus argutus TaxID=59490 RepID=A0AAW1VQ32_RUBAR
MGDMKEIRDAALAYYHNLSEQQKLDVYAFFQKMDTDGDGAITFKEFEQIFASSSHGDHFNRIFQDVDKNGDGSLDFEESVTLYYSLVNGRVIGCDGCRVSFIKGLYFTCVDCFHHNETITFDLCSSCYGSRNYVHHHSNFLDNYALLRSKAAYNNKSNAVLNTVNTGASVVNTGVNVANTVGNIASAASLCSIM